MTIWIRSVKPLYWTYVQEFNLWKVIGKLKTIKIKNGDILIFYLTGIGNFSGIFKVISDWHHPTEFNWPGEENNQDRFDYQVKLKPLFLGQISYKELPELKFLRPNLAGICLQSNPTGVSNFGRSITEFDYDLIKSKMKKIS